MLHGLKRALDIACGAVSALALFAIMALTFVDVTGRKFLAASVPGSLEMTELLMVVVIFASLPLVSLHGEHVVFDSLDDYLPRGVRLIQRLFVELFCAVALAGAAWLMWLKGLELQSSGDTTQQLAIPQGPFVLAMSALLALTALVHLLLVLTPAGHHFPGEAEEGAQ